MKITEVTINKPKSRESAMNQAVYFLEQIEVYSRRKENIMKNSKDVNDKIKRLEKTLEEYNTQMEVLDKNTATWESRLQELRLDYNLVESEIAELRSSLLREKIEQLRLKADTQVKATHNF